MKTVAMLVLLGLVTAYVVTMASMVRAQHSLERGWQITIYLAPDVRDGTPDRTRNILTIGPKFEDRRLCRDLLPAIREHFKGARKVDCE